MGTANITTEAKLLKSLARLEGLLGGDDDDLNKGQIVTGGGSSQGNMKDMHQEKYGDSWSDGIAEDGTDYKGRGKTAKKGRGSRRAEAEDEAEMIPDLDEDEYEDEREDEEDERDRRKSLPTPGKPLRTSKPKGAKTSVEPGNPSQVNKAMDFQETPVGKVPPPRPQPNVRRQFSGRQTSPLFGRRSAPQSGESGNQEGSSEQTSKAHGSGCTCKACKSADMEKNVHQPSVGPGGTGIRRSIEIEEDGEIRRGIEVSDFFYYLNKSVTDSLYDMHQRLTHRIQAHHDARGQFAERLADVVVGINKSLGFREDVVAEEEGAPAHAAKSVMFENQQQGASLQKSLKKGMDLRKSVLSELEELFEKGNVTSLDVVKFETSGHLRPEVQQMLKSLRQA